mgnify:CR=1 FL=1
MSETKRKEIIEEINKLPVLELAKMIKDLEELWGVKAQAAQVAVAAAPVEEAKEESTEFKVTLESFPAEKKIAIIKIVREISGLGLKEAKELVESAPKVLKESAAKAESDEIVKKITTAGGKASAKGL